MSGGHPLARLFVTGLSHKTAPVELREKLAAAAGGSGVRPETLAAPGFGEALLLSTCNRVEIYGAGDSAPARRLLAGRLGLDEAAAPLYERRGEAALEHLIAVACGLDSLVTGEPQILGQLKDAWEAARGAGTAGPLLDPLCQRVFAAARAIRAGSGIGENPVSVASAAAALARRVFESLEGKTVLVIGAGEMAELLAVHLHAGGAREFLFANRTLERAEALRARFGGRALLTDELPRALERADVVVASAGAPEPLVSLAAARAALKRRRPKPSFFIDLAVPRDVDPRVRELDGAYLCDIDDLGELADAGRAAREARAVAARGLVKAGTREIAGWLAGQALGRAIGELRAWAEAIAREEVARQFAGRSAGAEERAAAEALARRLVNKLLHAPISEAKRAAAADDPGGHERGLAVIRQFIGGRKP